MEDLNSSRFLTGHLTLDQDLKIHFRHSIHKPKIGTFGKYKKVGISNLWCKALKLLVLKKTRQNLTLLEKRHIMTFVVWCGHQCAIFLFLRGGRLTTHYQDEFNVTFEGEDAVGAAYSSGNFDNWTLRVTCSFHQFFY